MAGLPIPATALQGATTIGRLEIAMAPTDNNTILYAMAGNSASLGSGVIGVWKTINGGDTWTQVATPAAVSANGCRQCEPLVVPRCGTTRA
jgi:hypothetical protein